MNGNRQPQETQNVQEPDNLPQIQQKYPILPYLRIGEVFAMIMLAAVTLFEAYSQSPVRDPGTGKALSFGISMLLMSMLLLFSDISVLALDTAAFVLCGSALRTQSVKKARAATVTGCIGLALSAFWTLVMILGA